MRGWDGTLAPDSAAAALYEIWAHRHLVRAVMADWVARAETREAVLDEGDLYDVFEGPSVEVWISRVEDPAAWSGPDPRAARDRVLLASLAAAVAETESRLGPDWEGWRWGRLHTAQLRHPLSAWLEPEERHRVDVGPAPRGGSGATVGSIGYGLSDFVQRYGATFRMVLDVGRWDDSLAMNSPGQSGDPSSPHYRDLFGPWSRDEALPLLFSRERVLAAAERRILLRPARPVAAPDASAAGGPPPG